MQHVNKEKKKSAECIFFACYLSLFAKQSEKITQNRAVDCYKNWSFQVS